MKRSSVLYICVTAVVGVEAVAEGVAAAAGDVDPDQFGTHREAGARQDKFSGEKLKFPKALGSSDPEVVAAAWNEMRRTLNVNLRRAMTVGCDWQEILQLWSLAATTHKNELQQQYIEAAMLDEALTKCPPLHADVIIDAFDRVYFEGSKLFGSSAQMNDWKKS